MNFRSVVMICTMAAIFNAADTAFAQATGAGSEAAAKLQQPGAATAPTYIPPRRGAPEAVSRIGGGTRGWGGVQLPMVAVLAPQHTGLTIKTQPSLYWYMSDPTPIVVEVTLIDESAVKAAIELPIDATNHAGVYRLDLAQFGVTLTPGVEYEWSVALILDPEERSRDVIAQGFIETVQPPAAFAARLATASKSELQYLYADGGFWYDAMEAISDLIETDPANQVFRAQRSALLEQVHLPEAAAYDRRR